MIDRIKQLFKRKPKFDRSEIVRFIGDSFYIFPPGLTNNKNIRITSVSVTRIETTKSNSFTRDFLYVISYDVYK